jgi:hypothetical protein
MVLRITITIGTLSISALRITVEKWDTWPNGT